MTKHLNMPLLVTVPRVDNNGVRTVFNGPNDPVLDMLAPPRVDIDPVFDVPSEIIDDGMFSDFPINPLLALKL